MGELKEMQIAAASEMVCKVEISVRQIGRLTLAEKALLAILSGSQHHHTVHH
jgi:hypothetical protein